MAPSRVRSNVPLRIGQSHIPVASGQGLFVEEDVKANQSVLFAI